METKQIRQEEKKCLNFIKKVIDASIPNITKGNFIIKQSSNEEDTNLSFDAIYSSNIEISIRLRKYHYIKHKDFTIRYRSEKGYKTEIDKLLEGKGNLYFYGFLDIEQKEPIKWILFDINKIRHLLISEGTILPNQDNTELKVYPFQLLIDNDAIISYGWKDKKRYLKLDKQLKYFNIYK